MNKTHANPNCQSAELYYYDFLRGNHAHIPASVAGHIAECSDCQNEIQWLHEAYNPSEDNSPHNTEAIARAAQIQLHCALINQPVSCSTVKPFLPILAMPQMQVEISTAVTAHIQACPECACDLDTLKQLNLSTDQLSGLSQIFSHKQSEDLGGTETVTDGFFQDKRRSSIAIRRMMDRSDSGVITTFRTETSSPSAETSYHIEVTNNRSVTKPNLRIETQKEPVRQPTANASPPTRWFIKPIAAAAAVLVIAVLLFQNPSLKATDIGQIYEALKNVKNITMTQYDAGIDAPVQTTYISHSLGIKLFETSGHLTLYDIRNKTRKTKLNSASEIQQSEMDRSMVQVIAASMDVPWGLLPFKKNADLPDGAAWQKVQPAQAGPVSQQTEIFDLFWSTDPAGGNAIDYQWRCYLDPATKRPFKVEWRQKSEPNQSYELMTFTEITYPTDDRINEVTEKAGL